MGGFWSWLMSFSTVLSSGRLVFLLSALIRKVRFDFLALIVQVHYLAHHWIPPFVEMQLLVANRAAGRAGVFTSVTVGMAVLLSFSSLNN
jgi:hypothetical protein